MPLNYPKKYTDPEWKKAEKTIKVSATGIGETLRTLETAVKAASTALDHKTNLQTIEKIVLAAAAATKKPYDTMSAAAAKAKKAKNAAAVEYIDDLAFAVRRYGHELESLAENLANKHLLEEKLQDYIDRFNSRAE